MDAFGFLLKKTVSAVLLPPGIFLVLFAAGMLLVRKRFRLYLLALCVLLYAVSIEPTKDILLLPLEDSFPVPKSHQIRDVDAIVVLGGGLLENAPSLDGVGTLSSDSLARVMTAYRLHTLFPKPVITSAGAVFGKKAEAEIAREMLRSLGLEHRSIIAETKSRDTSENALFVGEICKRRGWKKIALVTSAFHMRRSVMLFSRYFSAIVPCPTDYKTSRAPYGYGSFLPDASNFADAALAIKEYLGIIYYRITLRSDHRR